MRLLKIVKSKNPRKKWTAVFSDGKRVDFGGRGYMDYTLYHAQHGPNIAYKKRKAYIARHSTNTSENWDDPQTPGSLARYILWEKPTLKSSIVFYKKKFNL